MAVVNQLNLNVGTEQNPNFVLHDINDKRISTTAVTTATHLLTCNSGVTSIAPITAANLASVLGVPIRDVHTQQTLSSYWVKIASTKFVKNENVQAAFLIESAYPQLYGILFINFRFSSSSVGNLVAKYVGSLDENCRIYYDPVVGGDIEIWVNLLGQYGHCCFRKLSECIRKNITNNMVLRDSGEITTAEVPTLTNYLVATPIS